MYTNEDSLINELVTLTVTNTEGASLTRTINVTVLNCNKVQPEPISQDINSGVEFL